MPRREAHMRGEGGGTRMRLQPSGRTSMVTRSPQPLWPGARCLGLSLSASARAVNDEVCIPQDTREGVTQAHINRVIVEGTFERCNCST